MSYAASESSGTAITWGGAPLIGVQSIGDLGPSKNIEDVSSVTDTSEVLAEGRPDYGEFTVELAADLDNAVHQGLVNTFKAVPAVAQAVTITANDQGDDALAFSVLMDRMTIRFPNEGPVIISMGGTLTTAISHS